MPELYTHGTLVGGPASYREGLCTPRTSKSDPYYDALPDSVKKMLGFGFIAKKNDDGCTIDKYNSEWMSYILQRKKMSDYPESAVLNNVTEIEKDCNLCRTNLEVFPVKRIGRKLYLDANSSIKDLSALESAKEIYVYAKNKDEMYTFLQNANLKPELIKKTKLIVKVY